MRSKSLNIRGERSVTCKGKFDAPPGTPLPEDAPAECEEFRKQPDALETAAELDKKYGRNLDLKAMPLYCTPMSFKGIYDTKDIRSTGGGDVKYAMDVPPKDSTLVSRLRAPARSSTRMRTTPNTTAAAAIRAATPKVERPYIGAGGSRESWGGMTCNPYDTERVTSRLERRLGCFRRGQSGRVLDLRNHRRFVPRSRQLSRRRTDRCRPKA